MTRAATLALLAVATLCASCGYRPVHGGAAGAKLHVVLVRSLVVDAASADEVVSGVREELLREGVLASGDGYPRVEVEVLRAASEADAIGAPSGVNAPIARTLEVSIAARAWIVSAKGEPPDNDTGDVRAADRVAPSATPTSDVFQHVDAARATGRRLGHALARRVLGHGGGADE